MNSVMNSVFLITLVLLTILGIYKLIRYFLLRKYHIRKENELMSEDFHKELTKIQLDKKKFNRLHGDSTTSAPGPKKKKDKSPYN